MISDISKFTTTYIVLRHVANNEVIWLEAMLMRRIGVTNAKRSPRYREHARAAGNMIDLQIAFTGSKAACEAYMREQDMPAAMQSVRARRPRHRAIKRLSDGQIFGNATQCAKENGIGKGSLSKHLNMVHGYDRIKDRWGQFHRFAYLDAAPVQPAPVPKSLFPVVHKETGIVYYDAATLEAIYNIDERTLAQHIARRPGFETIGQHVFFVPE